MQNLKPQVRPTESDQKYQKSADFEGFIHLWFSGFFSTFQ